MTQHCAAGGGSSAGAVSEAAHGDVAVCHAGFGLSNVLSRWHAAPWPCCWASPTEPTCSPRLRCQTCCPALQMNPHMHLRSKPR